LDAALVLDEHLTRIAQSLIDRGFSVFTVADFHAKSQVDPDVMRAIEEGPSGDRWVLVTMDGTLVDEYRGFDWARYAIAWVKIYPHLLGIEVERMKTDVVQRHAHRIVEQKPGDHHTYTRSAHYRHPPSLLPSRRTL
jgi:hypothetical protein